MKLLAILVAIAAAFGGVAYMLAPDPLSAPVDEGGGRARVEAGEGIGMGETARPSRKPIDEGGGRARVEAGEGVGTGETARPSRKPIEKRDTALAELDRAILAEVKKHEPAIYRCLVDEVGMSGEAHARPIMTPNPSHFAFLAPDTETLRPCILGALGDGYPEVRGYFGFSVFIDYKAGKLVLDAGYNRP